MRRFNTFCISLLIVLSCLQLNVESQGQNVYKGSTERALNKYYASLNSFIVNESNRKSTEVELKTVFRDGNSSLVQNDLNLLKGKKISPQTSLDEYLRAIRDYATNSEREKKVFKIEFKLCADSYKESKSKQYIRYLGETKTLSTIDVYKEITYGKKTMYIADHVTLYDGQIEKIESEKITKEEYEGEAPPPSIWFPKWPELSKMVGFSVGYAQRKLNLYNNGNDVTPIDLAWGRDNDKTSGLRVGLHLQPCFEWGLGLYFGGFFEYYYSPTPNSNKDTSGNGLLEETFTSFSEKVINVPVHLYYRLPFTNKLAFSVHGGVDIDYSFGAKYVDEDNLFMTYTPTYGAEARFNNLNYGFGIGSGLQYDMVMIEASWNKGLTNHDKFATFNGYSKATLSRFNISISVIF